MATGSIFTNNRTQAVRLPAEVRFPESIKKVEVTVIGRSRLLSPADSSWDSFFLADATVTEDFIPERSSQAQAEREGF